jgi:CubicO group peptidase (beta-lactamase class C family)
MQRRILVFGLFLALLAGAVFPAVAADAGGRWSGTIHIPGMELGVEVDLATAEGGAWKGDIDIPQQNARDLPLTDVKVDGSAVTFKIAGPPGDPTFTGTLAADGSRIEGQFTQNGQTFPFHLERPAPVGPTDEELAAHLREYVPKILETWKVPGLALAVIRDGKVVLTEGYGYRDLEKKVPVNADTLFAIGSSSKAFTTAALGILVDEGKLDWDKPVRTWMPDFKLHDPFATERMTPRDLVSHRSGLPRHDLMWYGTTATRADLVARLADLEPNVDFRSHWQYQNLMFMTAGSLVERVSGKSWEDFVRERLFTPLGMTASDLSVTQMETVENRSFGYREKPEEEGGGIEPIPYRNIDAIGPAGAINSNAVDMAKWVQFQLGDGTWEGKPILARSTLDELHRPVILLDGVGGGVALSLFADEDLPFIMYALGWFVQPYRGHLVVHHGGNIDGFAAFVTMLPKERDGVVVLTNLNGTVAPYILANHINDRLLGLSEKDWNGTFKARRDESRKAAKEAEAAVDEGRKKGTKPAHALDDYAGVYTHPSYGDLRIERLGKSLAVSFNALQKTPLEHWHYETWNVTEGEGEGTKINFQTNVQGDVDRLSLPLEPAVAAIVFTRKPPELTAEQLRRFEGQYELPGAVVTVALQAGNRLTVTVPGQPTYELLPYRANELKLKGLTGYSLRFEEENGVVTAASFVQPNGTFRAKKK